MEFMTDLRSCIRRGDTLAAILCIERLPDIDMRHANGMTSLHFSTHYGNPYITEVLIKRGASINIREYSRKHTPLHMAIPPVVHTQDRLTDALGCVRILLEAGASQTATCSFGEFPLYRACALQYTDLVKEMLKHDFDIDVTHLRTGDTALHKACSLGDVGIVKELCGRGFRLDATNNLGHTPLNISLANRNLETSRYLCSLNAPIIEESLEIKAVRFYKNQVAGKN